MFAVLMLFLSASLGIMWSLVFLLPAACGASLKRLSGRKLTSFLSKHVSIASIDDNEEKLGWICGKWYIGYIYETVGEKGDKKQLYVLMSNKRFKKMVEGETEEEDSKKEKKISFMEREGLYWHLTYPSRAIDVPTNEPWETQREIIEAIDQDFQMNGYSTVLLTGK